MNTNGVIMNESVARFLEQLKKLYASAFDLTEEAASGEWMFRIYGHFNADHSGYVLSKKAKLWEANCQEHLFVLTETEETPFDQERLCCSSRWRWPLAYSIASMTICC